MFCFGTHVLTHGHRLIPAAESGTSSDSAGAIRPCPSAAESERRIWAETVPGQPPKSRQRFEPAKISHILSAADGQPLIPAAELLEVKNTSAQPRFIIRYKSSRHGICCVK